jgi:hypothetical protein
MGNKILSMEQIKERYNDEWVLIEYEELDDKLNVKKGKVIAHSSRREEIYACLSETKGRDIAIDYIGKFPEDLAVMF